MTTTPAPTAPEFSTNELEIASYLSALGHRLLRTSTEGRMLRFHFPEVAAADARGYFDGASCPARDLLAAMRNLRILVQQQRGFQEDTRTGKDMSHGQNKPSYPQR